MELVESKRRNLLLENHLLTKNMSSLQSQINKLESNVAFSRSSVEHDEVCIFGFPVSYFQLIILSAVFELLIFQKGNVLWLIRD